MEKTALRACAYYDPSEDMISVTYDGQKDPEMFLEVKNRMLWFHQYLREKSVSGVVDDSDLYYEAGAQLLMAKATVYIDGQIAGKSCAGDFYSSVIGAQDPTMGQTLATQAKGRALANAGFGTANCVNYSKREDMADEPKITYKASAIRKCGYRPQGNMILLPGENGVQVPYLNVKYRVVWFNQYVAELPTRCGSYIDDSEVWYEPAAKLLMARAKVFLKGELAGTSCASIPYDPSGIPSSGPSPVLMVCTQAKGRALANAGFGVVASTLEDGNLRVPCDAGVRITSDSTGTPAVKPLYQGAPTAQDAKTAAPKIGPADNARTKNEGGPAAADKNAAGNAGPAEKVQTVSAPQPRSKNQDGAQTQTVAKQAVCPPQGQAPSKECPPMPLEKALAYVMPLGAYKGLTMGEIWGRDERIVRFYASPKFQNPRYQEVKQAAIAICGSK